MKLPTLTSLVGMQGDGKGAMVFQFKSGESGSHYVPIKFGVLNAMLPMILLLSKTTVADDGSAEAQPATLTGVRPAVFQDGTAVLELQLDGVPLRIAIDPKAIAPLRNALDQAQRFSGGSPSAH